MDYKTPSDAKDLDGLRLALTIGLPAPWSMSARFMFDVKKIPYVPVSQLGGGANQDLVAWTGHRNAPVAIYNDEPARTNWADIINLADRINPEPPLVPDNAADRIAMFGLCNEICGAGGLTWSARHSMVASMTASGVASMEKAGRVMAEAYGYSEEAAAQSGRRIAQVLTALASQLDAQRAAGSAYFIGGALTALDLVWASFSNTIRPLPQDVNPMNPGMRAMYEGMGNSLNPPEILFEHRDFIYGKYITLPLNF